MHAHTQRNISWALSTLALCSCRVDKTARLGRSRQSSLQQTADMAVGVATSLMKAPGRHESPSLRRWPRSPAGTQGPFQGLGNGIQVGVHLGVKPILIPDTSFQLTPRTSSSQQVPPWVTQPLKDPPHPRLPGSPSLRFVELPRGDIPRKLLFQIHSVVGWGGILGKPKT